MSSLRTFFVGSRNRSARCRRRTVARRFGGGLSSHPRKQPPQQWVHNVTLHGVVSTLDSRGLTITATKNGADQDWLILAPSDSTQLTIRATATRITCARARRSNSAAESSTVKSLPRRAKRNGCREGQRVTIVCRKGKSLAVKRAGARDLEAHASGGSGAKARKPDADSETASTESDDDSKTKPDKGDKPKAAAAGPKIKIAGEIASADDKGLTVFWGGARSTSIWPTHRRSRSSSHIRNSSQTVRRSKSRARGRADTRSRCGQRLVGAKVIVQGKGLENLSGNQCTAKASILPSRKPLKGDEVRSRTAKNTANK